MTLLSQRRSQTGQPLARLQDDMNSLFGRFFDDWGLTPWSNGRTWAPVLDLAEREDAVVVKAEVPGLKPDEIDISVQGNVLTISGEKKEEHKDEKDNYYHVERRHGYFRRDVTLPADVDSEKVEATCRDGVLTVTLPKSEQARPKRIAVKS
jgi:HSP20 family protein